MTVVVKEERKEGMKEGRENMQGRKGKWKDVAKEQSKDDDGI